MVTPRKTADFINEEYDELRNIAAAQMRNERVCHTLTGTALVHEVAAKVLNNDATPTDDRDRFLAFARKAMRNHLIDYARTKGRDKRGGNLQKQELHSQLAAEMQRSEESDIKEVLQRLAAMDQRKAEVVRLRAIEGLTLEETAERLQTSVATVKRDWIVARAWLTNAMKSS